MKSYGYYVTYIIGFNNKLHSINNLRKVLVWLNGFSRIEIIVVEQDKTSKLEHLNIGAKVIFFKTELPFNRSLCYNIGANHSNSDIIVFGDSNHLIYPNYLIESIKKTDSYDFIQANNKIINLTSDESLMNYSNIFNIDIEDDSYNNKNFTICDGIVIFKKESFFKICGWDEKFITSYCENKIMEIKIKKMLNHIQMPYKSYCLYENYKNDYEDFIVENENRRLNEIMNMDDDNFKKYINTTIFTGYGVMGKHLIYP